MTEQMFGGENRNPRDILARLTRKAKEEAGDLPLYYTEWNAGHFDTSYAAAAATQIFAYNEGLVEALTGFAGMERVSRISCLYSRES